MYHLYYWPTPNGHKITILLEELNVDFKIIPINIAKGDQLQKDFLEKFPNNKIPGLVDLNPSVSQNPISLFESGAILEYLADQHQRFLPPCSDPQRYQVLQWLYWQMGGLGPMAGQNHHFNQYHSEKIPYAIDRYVRETSRLYRVLNEQLESNDFVAGKEYSIADMAIYPWIVPYDSQGQDLENFPNLNAWFSNMQKRSAVQKAYAHQEKLSSDSKVNLDQEAKKILFGQT